ncbi:MULTISPECIES: sensor domain-containing diguanylate cyclase [Burkholderia]|uniref:diguanylate cyclase n=1 Tax=Burkholderia mayonis TaxID=1385591 RepID=A0A1B4FME6_9BURK|nr:MULTISPECIES: diguanylate cyclase [Burkholderia]AOJ04846.1 hypothetical protein WS70_24120 [Burkholderia mayonis]KVE41372.1 hypothetical protein WS69_28055 [Burkholderia sp. BDU5]KVE42906.1 hypothetical protein WS70_10460 [Burkholderia mayonis]
MIACIPTSRLAVLTGRHPWIVGALGTLMAFGVLSISLLTLNAARNEAIEHAHETSRNVTTIVVNNIARTIDASDHSLLTLISGLHQTDVRRLDRATRHALLFDRTAAAKYVTGMGMMDAQGHIVDGCCSASHAGSFTDRDYFLVHEQAGDAGLYVSKPYRSRTRGGVESIALSRRIGKPDGTFGGVAVVAIDVAYFQHLLSKLNVGPHGVSAIVHVDGTLVARNPDLPHDGPSVVVKSPTFPRMANQDAGFYAARSPIDGVLRLYTFERIPGTPLVAIVAPAQQDVLASWRSLALSVGISAACVSIAFSGVVWLLAFALRDRAAAQDRLLELSQTDPLTGLKNRRALDHALQNEWERLQRNESRLSILFIDADHFKRYNDAHGHAQGDLALQWLAACIARRARRPGGLAARYGGEEFVVILPDTDEAGAMTVAQSIRTGIRDAMPAGTPDTIPPFSVSVGCATSRRSTHASLDAFVRAADGALYRAKTEGRDRVVAADSLAPSAY